MVKEFLTQSYVSILSLLIGLIAATILLNQWGLLGIEIISLDNQQPNDYTKREYNLFMLMLFAGTSISGIGYGIVGIYRALLVLKGDSDKNRLTSH